MNKNNIFLKFLYWIDLFSYPFIMSVLFCLYPYVWKVEKTELITFFFIFLTLIYIFSRVYKGNKIGVYRNGEIIYSNILSLIICNFFASLILLLVDIPFTLWYIGLFLLQVIITIIWTFLTNKFHRFIYGNHRILLISGNEENAKTLTQKLENRKERFFVNEVILEKEGREKIFDRCQEYGTIMITDLNAKLVNDITKFCYENNKQLFTVPKISEIIRKGMVVLNIIDTPLYSSKRFVLSVEQALLKRVFDLVVAGITTIIASPFMLITAIAIKLQDGGPVLYKQKRLTKDGKEFNVYKFRSMILDAEKDTGARLSTGTNDDRITKVGKIIRAIRFDELPQLFNILKGDMSIVGPRPERPEIAEQYYEKIPEFKYRLKVKAGLTGYAQVYGKYNTTPLDKLKLDLMYIQNYSFLADLKICFYTVKILFMKESTEGVDESKKTAL